MTRTRAGIGGVYCVLLACFVHAECAAQTGTAVAEGGGTRSAKQGDPAAAGELKAFSQDIPTAATKIEMVPIPADATRGIKAFWMSKTEVTWEAFDVYAYRLDEPEEKREADATTRPSKPYLPPDRGFGHDGFAVISISHRNAQQFCAWLSEKSGRKFRLASEDEWEHAARAGATGDASVFVGGAGATGLGDHAWTSANSDSAPHKVGTKKANAFGLHDMAGNVREWVDGRDGKAVAKGGAYIDVPEDCAIAKRWLQERSWNASDPQMPKSKWWLSDGPFIGFRIVCEVEEKSAAEPGGTVNPAKSPNAQSQGATPAPAEPKHETKQDSKSGSKP